MAFVQMSGDTVSGSFPRAAATDIVAGQALTFDANGRLVPAEADTTVIAGISAGDFNSGVVDYNKVQPLMVFTPNFEAPYEARVVAGGPATAAAIGTLVGISADGLGVDLGGTGDQFLVTGFIDATTVTGKFNEAVVSVA